MEYLQYANSCLLTISETPLKTMESNAPIALKVKYALNEALDELAALGKWDWLYVRHTTVPLNWANNLYTLPYRLTSLAAVEYIFPNSHKTFLTRLPIEQLYIENVYGVLSDPPFKYALQEDNLVAFHPQPSTDYRNKFVIVGYKVPVFPGSDLAPIDIPDTFLNLLRSNVAAKLAVRLHNDQQLANSHLIEWERQLQTMRNRKATKSNVYRTYGRKRGIEIN